MITDSQLPSIAAAVEMIIDTRKELNSKGLNIAPGGGTPTEGGAGSCRPRTGKAHSAECCSGTEMGFPCYRSARRALVGGAFLCLQ